MMSETARKARKTLIGVVKSDRMQKTRTVIVERLVRHRRYGKYQKRRTICHARDDSNTSRSGDRVEIMETRPISKLVRWRILRIVAAASAPAVDSAAGAGQE